MKLQPNDIILKGDILHFDGEDTNPASASVGSLVADMGAVVSWVERPDPEPDLREHVKMLRNFLSGALPRIHQSKANDKFCEHAHAALEATK